MSAKKTSKCNECNAKETCSKVKSAIREAVEQVSKTRYFTKSMTLRTRKLTKGFVKQIDEFNRSLHKELVKLIDDASTIEQMRHGTVQAVLVSLVHDLVTESETITEDDKYKMIGLLETIKRNL